MLVDADPERPGVVSARPTSIVLADGQALVRAGLRALLETTGAIVVAGEAATGRDAVAVARRVRPDVVVLDALLPGLDYGEMVPRLRAESAAVMLLTASQDDDVVFAALRAGVSGLVVKDSPPAELVRAVDALARGDALLSSAHTRRLIAELTAWPEPDAPATALLDDLTMREREVVRLVALGLSNARIAERLVVSPATAKTHVSRAMVKLHARSRAQLVVFAYQSGVVHVQRGEHGGQ